MEKKREREIGIERERERDRGVMCIKCFFHDENTQYWHSIDEMFLK